MYITLQALSPLLEAWCASAPAGSVFIPSWEQYCGQTLKHGWSQPVVKQEAVNIQLSYVIALNKMLLNVHGALHSCRLFPSDSWRRGVVARPLAQCFFVSVTQSCVFFVSSNIVVNLL